MEAKLVMVFFANCVKCMSYDDTPPYKRENVLNSRLDVLLKRAVGILSGKNAPSYRILHTMSGLSASLFETTEEKATFWWVVLNDS